MTLTPEDLARIAASQRQANERAMQLLAEEMPMQVLPFKRNGKGHVQELPPVEAYAEHDAPRETTEKAPIERPKYVPWAELEDLDPPPRTWHIDGWLSTGATLFAGKGGIGKSLVAQTISTALALGRDYLGPVDRPLRVLQWACEDDRDELWRRQVAICQYLKAPLSSLGNLLVEPRVGLDNQLATTVYGAACLTPLMARLKEQVNDERIDVLFLDNIGQCFGANENARHDATLFVNAMVGLRPDQPFSTILLGHPARSQGSEFAGSAAWENSVRMRWYLGHTLPDQPEPEEGQEPDPNLRYLARRKSNYNVHDYVKLLWTEGVFIPESKPLAGLARYTHARQTEDAQQAVIYAIRKAAEHNVRVTRSTNTANSLLKWMRHQNLGADLPKAAIERAITQLMADGRIEEAEVGQYHNRTPAMGLRIKGERTI